MIVALYPMLKTAFALSFTQIGLISFTNQLTASLLQPLIGWLADRRPMPYSLAVGAGFTMAGLILLAFATHFAVVLGAVALVGVGSAVFHPEASRMAYHAAGRRRGFAQSLFQLGGNSGMALGPLVAVLIITRGDILWSCAITLVAMVILVGLGRWRSHQLAQARRSPAPARPPAALYPRRTVIGAMAVLLALIFSKQFYIAGLSSYLTFYLIEQFSVSVATAQLYLFVFLGSVAAGTLIGGPVGDRYGRKVVIWGSILGAAPFTLLLPYANLFWSGVLIVPIGIIIASAFSTIVVYAQEMLPGRVGMIAGLFFGFAFGIGGIGSALLGHLADLTSIAYVFKVCAFLPLIGLLAAFLPDGVRHR